MFEDLKKSDFYKNIKNFKKWSVTYQLLGLLIILISIPVTVLLVRSFALYLSKAAQYDVYFTPDPLELTTVTPQQVALMYDAGSDSVSYVQLEMTFDNSLINLAAPIEINPYFIYQGIGAFEVTDPATANSTGVIKIVIGGDETGIPPTGIFGIANLQFQPVTSNSTQTQITFNEGFTNVVRASDDVTLPTAHVPLTVNVNPSSQVNTPTPTTAVNPTATPTTRPANTPTPTTSPTGTGTISVDAVEDTYTDDSQPNTTFGSSTELMVTGDPKHRTFLKFQLPSSIQNAAFISSATLRMNMSSFDSPATQTVWQTQTTNWSEDTMTASNRVGIDGGFGSLATFTPNNTGYQEVDLTNYIRNSYSNGSDVVSFAVTNTTSNAVSNVYTSRETNNPPQLVIVTEDTPLPTATPTPTPTSTQPGDTTLSLTTADPNPVINTEFDIDTTINTGVNQVIGVELNVNFDPNRITAIDIVPGSFFSNPDSTNKVVDNNNGRLSLTILTPPTSNAVRGIGQLAVLTFRANTLGSTTLSIDSSSLVAAVGVQGNALENTFPLTINIQETPTIPGDIDNDGDVDIIDYGILFEDFGKSASDPSLLDPDSDINADGVVNILDYVVLFENFGRTV